MFCIVRNNGHLQSNLPLPPRLPSSFGSHEEYQKLFLENLKSELCFSVK
jgi:hypothetical protein